MAPSTTNKTSEPVYFYGVREQPHGIFSQFQKCTFTDPNYPNVTFNAAEQYMMHGKAHTFSNPEIAAQIIAAKTPKAQKALGQSVTGFSNAVWDKVKLGIVERGNYLKFTQNEKYKKVLLDTGDRLLVEASKDDKIWGIGFTAAKAKTVERKKWGQNLLGVALMNVRKKIREEEAGGEADEEVNDSEQETTDDGSDEQPETLSSATTTRKRKHDSITKDSDDEPFSPKTTSSKKARIDMTAEDIIFGEHTDEDLLKIITEKAAKDSMIHGAK